MKTCPQCNNAVEEGLQTCPYCGAELMESESSTFDSDELEYPQEIPAKENHVAGAVVAAVLLGVVGLPALILAIQSLMLWRYGNYEYALVKARLAKRWRNIAWIFFSAIMLLYAFYMIIFVFVKHQRL